MDEAPKKRCWKCGADKDIDDDFCRGGKDSVCKTCRYELNAEWAKKNREKLRPKRAEYMRAYRASKAKAKKEASESDDQQNTPSDLEK